MIPFKSIYKKKSTMNPFMWVLVLHTVGLVSTLAVEKARTLVVVKVVLKTGVVKGLYKQRAEFILS